MAKKRLAVAAIILLGISALSSVDHLHAQDRSYPSSTVVWSSDGQKLAVSTWNGIVLSTSNLQKIREFGGPNAAIFGLSWHPDNRKLAVANADYTISIWDTTTGTRITTLEGHRREVLKVTWSPDGTKLASSSNDRTIRIWASDTFALLTTIEYAASGDALEDFSAIQAMSWNAAGTQLAAGDRSNIYVWNITTQHNLVTKFQHNGSLGTSLSWMPNGQDLIAEGPQIWNIATGNKQLPTTGCSTGSDTVAALSPDGNKLASVGFDTAVGTMGCIVTFDDQYNETSRQSIQFKPNPTLPSSIAWNPDGTRIVTVIRNGTASIWDANSGEIIAYAPRPDSTTSILLSSLDVCASPDLGAMLTSNVENNQIDDFISNIQQHATEIEPNCRKELLLAAQYFLNNPTPTPQGTLSTFPISLRSLCSPSPAEYRVWLIQNPNPYDINFSWAWVDKAPSRTDLPDGVVPGASGGIPGKREFTTATQAGSNFIVVSYGEGLEVTASANDTQCVRTPD